MSLVDIRPELVRSRAQQIESLRQNDMETLRKIRTLVLTLEDVWKGRSEEVFVNKYLSQQNSISELYNTLQEFVTLLNDASNKANTIDSELLGMVNRIG